MYLHIRAKLLCTGPARLVILRWCSAWWLKAAICMRKTRYADRYPCIAAHVCHCDAMSLCWQHGLTPLDYTSVVWRHRKDLRDLQFAVRTYLHTVVQPTADSGTPVAVDVADCLRVCILNAAPDEVSLC